jgi:hypothetical protein
MATISIRLGAEHARFLEIVAARSGKTKSQVVRDALDVLHQRQGQDLVDESPYQKLAHLIGCFDSGEQALSDKDGGTVRRTAQGAVTPCCSSTQDLWSLCLTAAIRTMLHAATR